MARPLSLLSASELRRVAEKVLAYAALARGAARDGLPLPAAATTPATAARSPPPPRASGAQLHRSGGRARDQPFAVDPLDVLVGGDDIDHLPGRHVDDAVKHFQPHLQARVAGYHVGDHRCHDVAAKAKAGADAQAAAAVAPAMAQSEMGATPQAAPMPPPTSDLLPNAPGAAA